jgi:hypothetical protein
LADRFKPFSQYAFSADVETRIKEAEAFALREGLVLRIDRFPWSVRVTFGGGSVLGR